MLCLDLDRGKLTELLRSFNVCCVVFCFAVLSALIPSDSADGVSFFPHRSLGVVRFQAFAVRSSRCHIGRRSVLSPTAVIVNRVGAALPQCANKPLACLSGGRTVLLVTHAVDVPLLYWQTPPDLVCLVCV